MNEQRFRPPYHVDEAAARLGITPYQVRHAVRRGQLDGFKVGKTLLIRPECIDRLRYGEATAAEQPGG
jgi:excisionase family DNA binding protein